MMTFLAALCVVHLLYLPQLRGQDLSLDMMSDAFDDQYLGCAYQMEGEMEKVLDEELKYNQFYVMWSRATRAWASTKKDLNLPVSFKDQYGAAVVLYTMETPYPIYQQLNGNISIAGKSRDYYMDNFHFKALHFYLTRALQELSGGCTEGITTYRGVRVTLNVFPQLRFGQFASSSRNKDTAESFGKDTFFTISTCFGVDISALSQYEVEDEVLIPVAEKFYRMDQIIKTDEYTLRSSGEQCSYFNCAYLGGEKLWTPSCNSGTLLDSGSRTWLILGGLAMGLVLTLLY